jgi:hypothetical protein
LQITSEPTSRARSSDAAKDDIEPAPTTTARRPERSPSVAAATSRPTLSSDRPALSMVVSLRARFPTRSACWKSSFSARPAVPDSWARTSPARTWPRIWPSPTTIESSPADTSKSCCTARSS